MIDRGGRITITGSTLRGTTPPPRIGYRAKLELYAAEPDAHPCALVQIIKNDFCHYLHRRNAAGNLDGLQSAAPGDSGESQHHETHTKSIQRARAAPTNRLEDAAQTGFPVHGGSRITHIT